MHRRTPKLVRFTKRKRSNASCSHVVAPFRFFTIAHYFFKFSSTFALIGRGRQQINVVPRAIQIVAIMITNDFALQRHTDWAAKCRMGGRVCRPLSAHCPPIFLLDTSGWGGGGVRLNSIYFNDRGRFRMPIALFGTRRLRAIDAGH